MKTIFGATATALVNSARAAGIDPEKWGLWSIHAEDSNCDMGGPHSNPFIETFEGTFRDAAFRATIDLKSNYFTWGSGGYIMGPTSIGRSKTATTSDPIRAANERLTAAKKAQEEAEKDLAAAIRNVECRLGATKKLEPILRSLSNDEMNVAVEIFTGLVKNYTA